MRMVQSRFLTPSLIWLIAFGLLQTSLAASEKREPGRKIGDWQLSFVDTYRYENWDTFLAKKSTLDNQYKFGANRFALTLKYENNWTTFNATVHYVKFFGLPKTASTGAGQSYFRGNFNDQNHSEVYFKTLNFTFKRVGDKGESLTLGRFNYSSGREFKGDNPKVETVKSSRVANRLIGMGGSTFYQRSVNGVLLNRDNGRFHWTSSYWMPTAGGNSARAGDILEDIKVFTAAGTFKYDKFIPNQEAQIFYYQYQDNRKLAGPRPDNSGKAAITGFNLRIKNFGLSLIGAYTGSKTIVDTLFWAVIQRGDWFEISHSAYAYLLETGIQWKNAPWIPWLRVGFNVGSGDGNPVDGAHKTLFLALPTTRGFAYSTAYNMMNNRDAFIQLLLKPHSRTNIRMEYHRLRLAEGADRWYSGSGAAQDTGTSSGFTGRATGGSTDLGSSLDGWVSYNVDKKLTLILLASRFRGGSAVANTFGAEKNQNLTTLEAVFTF